MQELDLDLRVQHAKGTNTTPTTISRTLDILNTWEKIYNNNRNRNQRTNKKSSPLFTSKETTGCGCRCGQGGCFSGNPGGTGG